MVHALIVLPKNENLHPLMSRIQQFISFDEARRTLKSLSDNPYEDGTELMDVMMALDVYMRAIRDHQEVPDSELLRLLDPGGVIAEFGARCLYLRTGRDGLGWKPAETNGLQFITDKSDWAAYLKHQEAEQAASINGP